MKTTNPFIAAQCDQAGEVVELQGAAVVAQPVTGEHEGVTDELVAHSEGTQL